MRIVSGIVIEAEKPAYVPPAYVAPKVKPVPIKAKQCFTVYNADNDQYYGTFWSTANAQAWIDKHEKAADEDGQDQFGVNWDDCEVITVYTVTSS